jgi:hypothetical protein
MSEFDSINSLQGWKDKLAEILQEAEAAAKSNDDDARDKAGDRLHEFIMNSSPNTPETMALDDIAAQARKDLANQTISQRLVSIGERTVELTRLGKQFEAQASANETQAGSIRLDTVHRVVDSLTDSVRALTQLRTVLQDGKDDELAGSLDRVISSIQKLRGTIETQKA